MLLTVFAIVSIVADSMLIDNPSLSIPSNNLQLFYTQVWSSVDAFAESNASFFARKASFSKYVERHSSTRTRTRCRSSPET